MRRNARCTAQGQVHGAGPGARRRARDALVDGRRVEAADDVVIIYVCLPESAAVSAAAARAKQ